MKLLARIIVLLISGLLTIVVFGILFFGYGNIPIEELNAKYAPSPSEFIEIDGMKVHYRDEGSSTDSLPLVLIHGTGASLHTFDAWTRALKNEKRIIRMDIPAYGLTGPFPDADYSISNYVLFVEQFLTAIGIEKCILGGNSLGGNIAWQFTVKNPEVVEKLILIDAAGYPTQAKSVPIAFKMAQTPIINRLFTFITPRMLVKSSVKNVYADKSKVSVALVDRYFDLSLRKGNRQAFIDGVNMPRELGHEDKIKSIEQSTLVLWGEEDLLIPTEIAYKFHEDLPNDTLIILKNVGHTPMEESPEESLVALRSFLSE